MPLKRALLMIILMMLLLIPAGFAQTPTLLPFLVDLQDISFPGVPALHSFAAAQSNGRWLFIGGRTNGIHSFDPLPINNFPPSQANHWVWVVDLAMRQVWSVDLYDSNISPSLGLIA